MGDFFLDFRDPTTRRQSAARAASLLKWYDDAQVKTIERDSFSLVLTRVDGFDLWGPCEYQAPGGNILVALAGRIALDEREWDAARRVQAPGGLACKAILEQYLQEGLGTLGSLNGNFVALVHDERSNLFHLVTDRCGMFLAYGRDPLQKGTAICSHPDVLATILGEEQRFDFVSLAEFLTTGRLTFPCTYYQRIRGLDTGCIHTFTVGSDSPHLSTRKYFQFAFKIDPTATEEDLARKLAAAFGKAVHRRALPLFGQTAIGLSGGLDSRAVLSATASRKHIRTFCILDEENREFSTAAAIAKACGVELLSFRRDFDYYAKSAEQGVRISGGTGSIRSNHFLGVRDKLRNQDIQNLLTGCYCDYVFKALALNTRERPISRLQELDRFNLQFYLPCFWGETSYRSDVEARLSGLFCGGIPDFPSDEDWLAIERKRTFPLAYEGDSAMRVITQRVAPWYIPIVDNELLDVYLQTPSRFKLNASVFEKMVALLCNEAVCRIPDSNTGARVGASWPTYMFHRYFSALQNRVQQRIFPRLALQGSWPNWEYYIHNSPEVAKLWAKESLIAGEVLTRLLGRSALSRPIRDYCGRDTEFFTRLWTLKLWLDNRVGSVN